LKDRLIGRLTEDDLERAFDNLADLAGATWNKYRQTVRHLQRWGIRKGYLARPWLTEESDVQRKKGARRTRRLIPDVLDAEGNVKEPGEERRLLTHAGPWLQRLIIAALETCCRMGELLSLQWRDIDLARGEFTVRAENAKDDESRVLPISPRLRAVLEMERHRIRRSPLCSATGSVAR
jgi:integrase